MGRTAGAAPGLVAAGRHPIPVQPRPPPGRAGPRVRGRSAPWSVRDRAGFWAELVRILGIRFDRPYEAVVDLADGPEHPRWFPGALLNIADSCFRAEPEAIALRQHSEGGDRREVTYRELERLCNRVAGGLVAEGLAPGDSVGLLLPLTIEAVAALLGVLRAGCVAVCVAESFAPPEVAPARPRRGPPGHHPGRDPSARLAPAALRQARTGRRIPGRRHPVGRRVADRGPATSPGTTSSHPATTSRRSPATPRRGRSSSSPRGRRAIPRRSPGTRRRRSRPPPTASSTSTSLPGL